MGVSTDFLRPRINRGSLRLLVREFRAFLDWDENIHSYCIRLVILLS